MQNVSDVINRAGVIATGSSLLNKKCNRAALNLTRRASVVSKVLVVNRQIRVASGWDDELIVEAVTAFGSADIAIPASCVSS